MSKILFILCIICTYNLSAQNEVDTIQNLDNIFVKKLSLYKGSSVKKVLDSLPYQIFHYHIISTPFDGDKTYCLGIQLFLQNTETYNIIDDILVGDIDESNGLEKANILTIYYNNIENLPYFESDIPTSTHLSKLPWIEEVREKLQNIKYTVKNITVN
ncbi:hypothetical protein [Wenyingzhuangia sp. IMCC45574]